MPTYEYVCTECATPLEVVASFSDPPLTQCPACGGRLRKVFGNVGVVFKGSGFYRTDNRSKTASAKATSSTAEKASGSNGSSKPKESTSGSGSTASGSGSTASGSGATTSSTPAAASAS